MVSYSCVREIFIGDIEILKNCQLCIIQMQGFQAMSVEMDVDRSRFGQFRYRAIAKKLVIHSTPHGKIRHLHFFLFFLSAG